MTLCYVKTIAKKSRKLKIKFICIDKEKNTKIAKNGIFSKQDVINTGILHPFYKTSSYHQYHKYSIYLWIAY